VKITCSKCSGYLEPDRIGRQRYCLKCNNEANRNSRPKYNDLSDDEKLKSNIRAKVKMRIRRGLIKRLPCEICGNPKSEAHHDDYSKIYEVRFLCRKHHNEYHKLNVRRETLVLTD
jgi:hypothetical protein